MNYTKSHKSLESLLNLIHNKYASLNTLAEPLKMKPLNI